MLQTFIHLSVVVLVAAAPATRSLDAITLFDAPYGNAFPCDLSVGQDNNVYSFDPVNQYIIVLDTSNGGIVAYNLEEPKPEISPAKLPVFDGQPYLPCAVRTAPNGQIYAINGYNNQVHVVTTTKPPKIQTFDLDVEDLALSDVLPEPSSTFYTANTTKALEVEGKKVKTIPVSSEPGKTPLPLGLFRAADGSYYFSTTTGNTLVQYDASTNSVENYLLPEGEKCLPAYIRAQVGSTIYFTCFDAQAIMYLNTSTSALGSISSKGYPSQETVDSSGTVWWTSTSQDTLEGFNSIGPQFTFIDLPAGKVTNPSPGFISMVGVQYEQKYNRVYFVQQKYNRFGYLQLSAGQ